ncbi:MAG: glycosyltransferase [Chloroflexota bacterium]
MPHLPLVTLILAIRNEARYIERCLNSVLAQDYPPDRLEILIAYSMSSIPSYSHFSTL